MNLWVSCLDCTRLGLCWHVHEWERKQIRIQRKSITVCFTWENLNTSHVLCDLHSPCTRAVMFWHLFSVLKIRIQMSWCGLVQSHGRYQRVKKSPMSHDALQASLLQTVLPASGAWGNFVLQKQNSLPFFFLLRELQLNWIQSFSSSLLLQGVSSWKLYAGTIYRTRHLPRDWLSKSCKHLSLPFPSISVCVCWRKRASGMSTAPDCSVWRRLSTWMVTGHFTDYKNLKTQAQEMRRMRSRCFLH